MLPYFSYLLFGNFSDQCCMRMPVIRIILCTLNTELFEIDPEFSDRVHDLPIWPRIGKNDSIVKPIKIRKDEVSLELVYDKECSDEHFYLLYFLEIKRLIYSYMRRNAFVNIPRPELLGN